jgi:methenyltetrahydrofolate cyclohydrolase (EC 3.5.4.9)/5,10-methylenetetrahydrofolate dehydrogenase (NADP+) (EC 1.5.1.5)
MAESEKWIDGRAIAAKIREELKRKTESLKKAGIFPTLAVILIGNNPASETYVRNKQRAAKEIGIGFQLYRYPADVEEWKILERIDELNGDVSVHGILVQLPLPPHIRTDRIIRRIDPKKDVDGFHPVNIGNLMHGMEGLAPCTPLGIMTMLDEIGAEIRGKEAVVVGRSMIVGRPLAQMLINRDATVTVCHSKTENLRFHTSRADLLIVAIGHPRFIREKDVKEGAIVIDVGINRDENGKLCGDVAAEEVLPRVSRITPVPGGVGPMTITMLLSNTLTSAERLSGKGLQKVL